MFIFNEAVSMLKFQHIFHSIRNCGLCLIKTSTLAVVTVRSERVRTDEVRVQRGHKVRRDT